MPAENIRTVVTKSLIGMIAAVTSTTPPANEPMPPFIQGPIDRAVDRINKVVEPGVTLAAARAKRLYLAGPMTGIEDFNYPPSMPWLNACVLQATSWKTQQSTAPSRGRYGPTTWPMT